MLAILYTFIDYEHFADRCRQLYFVTDAPSEASFIIVNAGFTYIFFEASLKTEDPVKKARYEECRAMSQNNLEIALAQLNMMMPATAENIEALLMGVGDPIGRLLDRSKRQNEVYIAQGASRLINVSRPLSASMNLEPRWHGSSCPELRIVRLPYFTLPRYYSATRFVHHIYSHPIA